MKYAGIEIWPFKLNWREGLTETLEWKTDVMGSRSGAEQRVAQRQSPRRFFEGSFLLEGAARGMFDAFMVANAGAEFAIPLWHAQGIVESATGNTLMFDTRNLEFQLQNVVLLRNLVTGEMTCSHVEAMSDGSLQLAANFDSTKWGRGTLVYPMRMSVIEDPSSVLATKLNDRVMDARIRFKLAYDNEFEAGAPLGTYRGFGILQVRPDESETLNHSWIKTMEQLDSGTGYVKNTDISGNTVTTQMYRWSVYGNVANNELREYLYHLRGRQRAVWVPTFNQDMIPVEDLVAGSADITIENIGYAEYGLKTLDGRKDIRIETFDNKVIHAAITNAVTGTNGRETITLAAPIGEDIPKNRIRSISFMSLMRMDTDRIELTHLGDSHGYTSVGATWRSAPNRRVAGAVEDMPYGDTWMNEFQTYCYCTSSITRGSCVGRHEMFETPFVMIEKATPGAAEALVEEVGQVCAVAERARTVNQEFDFYTKVGAIENNEWPTANKATFCGYNRVRHPQPHIAYPPEYFGGGGGGSKIEIYTTAFSSAYPQQYYLHNYKLNGQVLGREFDKRVKQGNTYMVGGAYVVDVPPDEGKRTDNTAMFKIKGLKPDQITIEITPETATAQLVLPGDIFDPYIETDATEFDTVMQIMVPEEENEEEDTIYTVTIKENGVNPEQPLDQISFKIRPAKNNYELERSATQPTMVPHTSPNNLEGTVVSDWAGYNSGSGDMVKAPSWWMSNKSTDNVESAPIGIPGWKDNVVDTTASSGTNRAPNYQRTSGLTYGKHYVNVFRNTPGAFTLLDNYHFGNSGCILENQWPSIMGANANALLNEIVRGITLPSLFNKLWDIWAPFAPGHNAWKQQILTGADGTQPLDSWQFPKFSTDSAGNVPLPVGSMKPGFAYGDWINSYRATPTTGHSLKVTGDIPLFPIRYLDLDGGGEFLYVDMLFGEFTQTGAIRENVGGRFWKYSRPGYVMFFPKMVRVDLTITPMFADDTYIFPEE